MGDDPAGAGGGSGGEGSLCDLVCRMARGGDPRMLEVLYDRFGGELLAFLIVRLRDRGEAEDALQRLFLDLARRPRQVLGVRSLGRWLFAKARNLATDRWRVREREARRQISWPSWLEPAVAGADGGADPDAAGLARALDALPAAQREVVAMKIFQGLTFADVGARLGISMNTAASRYRYALAKLREHLAREGGDERRA